MKVTFNWLKQYVDFDWSPEDLTGRLTMLGLEVEGIEKLSGEFEGIVVGQVLSREKHPNADKLSLCRVNDGQGERQIVCGATNFKPGDKVPLILPGASLPPKSPDEKPFTIKVGKIRGIESHGMMCSPEELGMDPEAIGSRKEDGLLILRDDAKVGQPFAEYLGRSGSDVVYDLEVTPNRPDWNSVIGIAREISALTGNELKVPDCSAGPQPTTVTDHRHNASDLVAVRIEAPEFCPRYTARVIQGVRIGPSPDWLRNTLEKVGLRSINNVVDVTNFVMLETGQPLHAFDYHLIAKGAGGRPTIVVRRADPGEAFVTLDDREQTLNPENLLIADEQKGIALAGVMGGLNTEINDRTSDVLIESAFFAPSNIRRTSKSLSLRTDSSYRFERGCDPNWGVDYASRRAAQLIVETAGGFLAEGIVDAYPQPVRERIVTLRPQKLNELLGIEIPNEEQSRLLVALGIEIDAAAAGGSDRKIAFKVPTFRPDIKREVDLIEEIARLYGVDRIPSTPPRGAFGSNPYDTVYDQISEARRVLAGLGLNEAQGQTLISGSDCGVQPESAAALANPLSSDMDVLRPSLLPGLIHCLKHNINRKNPDVTLFEIGRVFEKAADGRFNEGRRLAVALTGARANGFWAGEDRKAKFDAFDLKGILEELFEHFGLRGVIFATRESSPPLFLESAGITLGGKLRLGQMGQLNPRLAKENDLRDPVFLAELDLDQLLSRRNPLRNYKPLPQFPPIRRDIAMIVPEKVTHDTVVGVVRKARPENLENTEVFDVFRGNNVSEGHKSLAYAFTYRSNEKTLTDAEVNSAHSKVVEALKRDLKAIIRE